MVGIDGQEPEDKQPEEDTQHGFTQCPTCGRDFLKKRSWAVFCGQRCRMRHHQLERKEAVAEYRKMVGDRFRGTDLELGGR